MGFSLIVFGAAFLLSGNGPAIQDTTSDSSAVFHMPAAPDSSRPVPMAPIEVSARRPTPPDPTWIPPSARAIYSDDGAKLLLSDLRITSMLAASAVLRLYGLPVDQTARDYVWGHRIGGPVTSVFGSRTKVNPDVESIALHSSLMSHQFHDTNGSLEWRPQFQTSHLAALSVSSDLIERRATLSLAHDFPSGVAFEMVTATRQSDVVPLLERAVSALKAIPRYTDSQTYTRLRLGDQTVEGFFLFGTERGNWRDIINGAEAVILENTRQDLGIVRYQREMPLDSKLSAGVSWESDQVVSEHTYSEVTERMATASHIVQPRFSYSMWNGALTAWTSQFWVANAPEFPGWHNNVDGGVETRTNVGWLTVQPSLAFQRFHDEGTWVHGLNLSARRDQLTWSAGYGTYVDYLRFREGTFGNVFEPGAAQRAQYANHYVASLEYRPTRRGPFDFVRTTAVRKDLDIDLWDIRDRIRVLSWDCIVAKMGNPSWELAVLTNDARGSQGPVTGLIPVSLRLGVNTDLGRRYNLSSELNFRSGSVAQYREPDPREGQRFMLGPSYFVNLALARRFRLYDRPAQLILTVFNALAAVGSRAELTVDGYGNRHDAPCWGNLRFRYDL